MISGSLKEKSQSVEPSKPESAAEGKLETWRRGAAEEDDDGDGEEAATAASASNSLKGENAGKIPNQDFCHSPRRLEEAEFSETSEVADPAEEVGLAQGAEMQLRDDYGG